MIKKTLAWVSLLVIPFLLFVLTDWILTGHFLAVNFWQVVLPFAVYYLAFSVLTAISRRPWISLTVVQILYMLIMIISSIMMDQRGSPFFMSDLFAVGDGMAYAGKINLAFPRLFWVGILVSTVLIAAFSRVKPLKLGWLPRLLVPVLSLTVLALLFTLVFWQPANLKSAFGITNKTWDQVDNYQDNGVFLGFLLSTYPVRVAQPDDYTPEHLTEILSDAKQSQTDATAEMPDNVIIIMSESFADLSAWDPSIQSIGATTFYDQLKLESASFNLVVPTFGGTTCNSEYELLTGQSIALYGTSAMPYYTYLNQEIPSLARLFELSGYQSSVLHPNESSYYNRDRVYDLMGFDQYLSIEDFEGAETIRGLVSDQAAFDRVLDIVDANDAPQFIFLITIQNHMPYTADAFTDQERMPYGGNSFDQLQILDAYDGPGSEKVNGFLTLLQQTDLALQSFIEQLESSDENTAVLYFGDHLPAVGNDFIEAFSDDAQPFQKYTTPGLLWTNYGLDLDDRDLISTNFLGSWLCRSLGIPMTDYWQFNQSLMEKYKVLSVGGLATKDGAITRSIQDPGVWQQDVLSYYTVQYDAVFGQQYSLEDRSVYLK